jgi:hypothetical protein
MSEGKMKECSVKLSQERKGEVAKRERTCHRQSVSSITDFMHAMVSMNIGAQSYELMNKLAG